MEPYGRWVHVDTGAWFALSDDRDQDHVAARTISGWLTAEGYTFVTTNFIVAETHALALVRRGPARARTVLRWLLDDTLQRVRIEPADEERAVEIIEQYADKVFSYTDATSVAVMRRLGIDTAFTFDRHFAQFGVAVLEAEDA
jgi:uncharacterized protein